MLDRYSGKGTWALVTGASDGIGAEYCRQLAAMGFSIILVSRTRSKLEKIQDEVKKINPDVGTHIIVADFTNNSNIEFYKDIVKQVGDRELSIVIANAGLLNPGFFMETEMMSI